MLTISRTLSSMLALLWLFSWTWLFPPRRLSTPAAAAIRHSHLPLGTACKALGVGCLAEWSVVGGQQSALCSPRSPINHSTIDHSPRYGLQPGC
jgi:hypothetical protein